MLLTATRLFAWTGCGLTFDLPPRWSAAVIDRNAEQCEIGLRPAGWKAMRSRSRWPEDEYAIHLERYFGATLDTATDDLDFQTDNHGRWGVPEFRGMITPAKRVRYGAFAGWRCDGLERGYANEGAELGEQSRIYSGTWVSIALADAHRTVVSITYSEGSPDIHVDIDKAAMRIARSLRRATPPTARTP